MKIKQVYISDDNFEKLKKLNASQLVNELLNDHFKTLIPKTKEELLEARRIALIKLEALNKMESGYIPEIQNG